MRQLALGYATRGAGLIRNRIWAIDTGRSPANPGASGAFARPCNLALQGTPGGLPFGSQPLALGLLGFSISLPLGVFTRALLLLQATSLFARGLSLGDDACAFGLSLGLLLLALIVAGLDGSETLRFFCRAQPLLFGFARLFFGFALPLKICLPFLLLRQLASVRFFLFAPSLLELALLASLLLLALSLLLGLQSKPFSLGFFSVALFGQPSRLALLGEFLGFTRLLLIATGFLALA